jgi:hypothetical protein
MRIAAAVFPLLAALALAGAPAAGAAAPTCVTLCQQKADACGEQCQALAQSVYRDPASFDECQLGCAKTLFTSCVEGCSQTGEVATGDYGLVAEDPDHLPSQAPAK